MSFVGETLVTHLLLDRLILVLLILVCKVAMPDVTPAFYELEESKRGVLGTHSLHAGVSRQVGACLLVPLVKLALQRQRHLLVGLVLCLGEVGTIVEIPVYSYHGAVDEEDVALMLRRVLAEHLRDEA